MEKLTTSIIAARVNCHPNTVRLYETWGFLPPVPRARNGYRVFSERHLRQMVLARAAMPGPYPGGGDAVPLLVKASAAGDHAAALRYAERYRTQVVQETKKAKAVLDELIRWFDSDRKLPARPVVYSRREAARVLGLTIDRLRTWERNDLVRIGKNGYGYCMYSERDLSRLKIIAALRKAGYSVAAIHQMFLKYDKGTISNISARTVAKILNTPSPDAPILYVTDRWLTTLAEHKQRAMKIIRMIKERRTDLGEKISKYDKACVSLKISVACP